MTYDSLSLMSGVPILLEGTEVKVYQPSIREIALVGEKKFFNFFNIFLLDLNSARETIKTIFSSQVENINLVDDMEDFDIYMLFLQLEQETRENFCELLMFLIKDFKVIFNPEDNTYNLVQNNLVYVIDENLFFQLKNIVFDIFVLEKFFNVQKEPPKMSAKAKAIADKIKKSRERLAQTKGESEQKSILSLYLSVLGIGTNGLDITKLCSVTVYQLLNQFDRYSLYTQYEQSVQAAMAGAKVDIVDWLIEI